LSGISGDRSEIAAGGGDGADKSEIWKSFGAVEEKEDLAVRVSAKRESKAFDLGKDPQSLLVSVPSGSEVTG
jgi:hypothetical protein